MDWLQLLPLFGIGTILGGVVGGYFQSQFQHRTRVKEWEHELKKKRYLCINLLIITKLNIDKALPSLQLSRPEIQTEEDLDREILMEYNNSTLFASNRVIWAFKAFLANPNHNTYTILTIGMRRDLWGERSLWKK